MVAASVLEQRLDTPKSLCDWVRNFRIKKVAMRRRRGGGDLRVAAILSTALSRAEAELRRKQSERALRWSELQSKLLCKDEDDDFAISSPNNSPAASPVNSLTSTASAAATPLGDMSGGAECNSPTMYHDDEEMEKHRKQIESYWKCELSGLDEFFNSLSGGSAKSEELS